MAFVLIAGGTYAVQQTKAPAPKPEIVYTYYLEGDCSNAIECSPDYEGVICEQLFEGLIVYSQPGCEAVHQTSNIIGKRQP
ncbi:hypothetical protein SAMN04488121_102416 [Chitinophaga filiformis]|uniref:Uncharacterized protein n=2 Tax=Chitinophaga filiformis TaxID=104663 RepID=A0A1G7MGM7_CHIFI|nr:hypothetical protein SAMN04488121_102416 [Chitinophaga filiformis]